MHQNFRHLSAFTCMQIPLLVLGMTKLLGNCSSASQLSGTSALNYRLQRS